jgi:hypothetical protein
MRAIAEPAVYISAVLHLANDSAGVPFQKLALVAVDGLPRGAQ